MNVQISHLTIVQKIVPVSTHWEVTRAIAFKGTLVLAEMVGKDASLMKNQTKKFIGPFLQVNLLLFYEFFVFKINLTHS